MVKMQENCDAFHGTLRSRQRYMDQTVKINNLDAMVKDLQDQVAHLNEIIAN